MVSLTMVMNWRKHHLEKNKILFLVGSFNHVNHDGERCSNLTCHVGSCHVTSKEHGFTNRVITNLTLWYFDMMYVNHLSTYNILEKGRHLCVHTNRPYKRAIFFKRTSSVHLSLQESQLLSTIILFHTKVDFLSIYIDFKPTSGRELVVRNHNSLSDCNHKFTVGLGILQFYGDVDATCKFVLILPYAKSIRHERGVLVQIKSSFDRWPNKER